VREFDNAIYQAFAEFELAPFFRTFGAFLERLKILPSVKFLVAGRFCARHVPCTPMFLSRPILSLTAES
jgi:hypothetical protein